MTGVNRPNFIFLGFLILFLLYVLTGCGRRETVVTTEEPVDITAGFEAKRDYVETTQADTVLYRGPSVDAEVYMKLNAGVNLDRTGVKGGWTRVRLNDTSLYVQTGNVKLTQMVWAKQAEKKNNNHVVFIDPAKQIYADKETESIFPGGDPETEGKARMSRATVGTGTGAFEYDVTMNVANALKAELEMRGYRVILSRTVGTVSLSNSERASAGNQSDAEILIRITATGSSVPATKGVFGLITSVENPNTKDNYQDNFYLANSLITETCTKTKATRLGIYQTDRNVFLNYSKKPAAVIQVGFLSNEEEDKKLSDKEYQENLASGLADGIDSYFQYNDEK